MAVSMYGKGLIGLIKRGWNEYPEIMASSVLGLVGLTCAMYGAYRNQRDKNLIKPYKHNYTVYRPDDPKVAELRHYKIIE